MNKKFLIFVSLIILTFSSNLFAYTWLGVGNLTHNFLSAQSDATGGKKVFEVGPAVIIGTDLPFFFTGIYFSPGIGYAKFFPKDSTTKSEIILQYHLNQIIFSGFNLRYGVSNYITKIGGSGGTTILSNGNSTATFYIPSETKTSYTASVDLGADMAMTQSWTLRMQISIPRFLSSRRKVDHLLTANYLF
jgi:hypothetical protein